MRLTVFKKSLMQRFRSILQILDPLVDRGHEMFIHERKAKTGKQADRKSNFYHYAPADFFLAPWGVDVVNLGALVYLRDNFGFSVKHLKKIHWVKSMKEDVKADIVLATDFEPLRTQNQVNLPHISFHSKTKFGDTLVGNSMAEAVYQWTLKEKEHKGQLLIVWPGGGRSILSPLRKHISKQEVIDNNIALMQKLWDRLPKNITNVVIKTHPAPYINCNGKALKNLALPHAPCPVHINITETNFLPLVARSEYILSLGSSTTTWLLGSDKKWLTVIDCAGYDFESTKRRDNEFRTEKVEDWQGWPQKIVMNDLTDALENYSDIQKKQELTEAFKKYQEYHRLPYTENMVKLIERVANETSK